MTCALFSDSMDKLEEMLMDMDESCSERGLTISEERPRSRLSYCGCK